MSVTAPDLSKIRQRLESNGVSVTAWAQAHGFRREDVYAVLNGRSRCRRGKGHLIAVALGLKQPVALDSGAGEDRPAEGCASGGAGDDEARARQENAMT